MQGNGKGAACGPRRGLRGARPPHPARHRGPAGGGRVQRGRPRGPARREPPRHLEAPARARGGRPARADRRRPRAALRPQRAPALGRLRLACAVPPLLGGHARRPRQAPGDLTPMASNKTTTKTPTSAPKPLAPGATLTLGATKASTEEAKDGTLTLRLTRVIKAPAERIYQCFLDPDALAKWIPPHGFVGHVDRLEPNGGGRYHISLPPLSKRWTQCFRGDYKEIHPGQ